MTTIEVRVAALAVLWTTLAGVLLSSCQARSVARLESTPAEELSEVPEGEMGAGSILVLADPLDAAGDPGANGPCRVIVWLRGVYYGGDDVGDRWEYAISVNGRDWVADERELTPGSFDRLHRRVFDQSLPDGCGVARAVSLTVRAREKDGFLDDTGCGSGFAFLPCSDDPTGARASVLVPVREAPSFIEPLPTASLLFLFQLETRCEGE